MIKDLEHIAETAVGYEKRRKRTNNLPKFYGSVLSQTLRSRVEESLSNTSDEQLSLLEELALLRESALPYISHFSKAYESYQSNPDDMKAQEMAISAGTLMQSIFEKISKCAKTVSDIKNAGKDKISVFDLQDAINQTVRIIFEACGEDNIHIAQQIERRLESDLTFMQEKTDITPDQVVMAMDDTIPYVPKQYDDGNGNTAVI